MFEWLKQISGSGGDTGLPKMTRDLERMITEGRHAFDAAFSVLVGGADPGTVREDLLSTDKRIDALEQSIRRQIIVHGSISGSAHLPELMILMSVAKDAERIGDYAKNLFAISVYHTFPKGTAHHEELQSLRLRISSLLAEAPALYESQDEARATEFITNAQTVVDECEQHMTAIFGLESSSGRDSAAALAFRHSRRVAGHVQNVVTSIVNPVDRLDFNDEPSVPEVK